MRWALLSLLLTTACESEDPILERAKELEATQQNDRPNPNAGLGMASAIEFCFR